jgi:hypothetical protein
MDSSERGALGIVWVVAICVILIGLLDAGIYFTGYLVPYAAQHHDPKQHLPPMNILRIILDSIPVIAGIVMLIKARAIADWLSELIE